MTQHHSSVAHCSAQGSRYPVVALALCGVMAVAAPATATVITVDDDRVQFPKADFTTIQDAITAATAGDEVVVYPGTYTNTGEWVINPLGKSITIRAAGSAAETILDGQGQRRVVMCNGGEGLETVISGFMITGGYASGGGEASCGAGVYLSGASPTIANCTISGNIAVDATDFVARGGAVHCANCSSAITGCTISGNSADTGGGISILSASPTISNCTISGNTAGDATNTTGQGGGIASKDGSPTITGCTISGNGSESAGGLFINNGSARLSGCAISDNTASGLISDGGGIRSIGGTPIMTDCTITNNKALGSVSRGGGLSIDGGTAGTISGCTISGNNAREGGGVFTSANGVNLTACTISGNVATSRGGGVCYASSASALFNCVISGNTVTDNFSGLGGGIYHGPNFTDPLISNCVIFGNAAQSGGGFANYVFTGGSSRLKLYHTSVCANTTTQIYGSWTDAGVNCIATDCSVCNSCLADISGDGTVDGADLTALLSGWGPCTAAICPGDLDASGVVSGEDLTVILSSWGLCP